MELFPQNSLRGTKDCNFYFDDIVDKETTFLFPTGANSQRRYPVHKNTLSYVSETSCVIFRNDYDNYYYSK